MILVIAEKPSVAADIAKVIGADKKARGYYSGTDFYVTWCVGHLIEPAMPDEYNGELKKWSLDTLPFFPSPWKYKVNESTKAQFDTVKKLMQQSDVTELICATDAGREGELIFRLVYQQAGCKKPFKRLWINSMEDKAIRNGFNSLRNSSDYDNLYAAALARQQADYVVGINASRLFSCLYKAKLNVGRVQSPTLKFVVDRYLAIQSFKPEPYFIVTADCGNFKALTRIDDDRSVQAILERCSGKDAYVSSVKSEEKRDNPPTLFDLTALQQESNERFGYTAKQTLDLAQALYEKKLLTYPRTDSRYLTEDMDGTAAVLIEGFVNLLGIDYDLAKADVKRLINNAKVSDHHAILPTVEALNYDVSKLPESEQKIIVLVTYRLLAAAYTPYIFKQTTIVIDIEGESFKATGRQELSAGYRELLLQGEIDEGAEDEEETALPIGIAEGQIIQNVHVSAVTKITKPPKPYTEKTLLSAMENAGQHIADDTLKAAIKGSGLGTSATRADTIEHLVRCNYIQRKGRNLIPTSEAITLIDKLPEALKQPELTAEWEQKLEQVSQGTLDSQIFLGGIRNLISSLVDGYKLIDIDITAFKGEGTANKETIGRCPRCGKNIVVGKNNYYCEGGRECGFTLWPEDKFFVDREAKPTKKFFVQLLKAGKAELNLKSAKTGNRYDGFVVLTDTGKYVNYKIEFKN